MRDAPHLTIPQNGSQKFELSNNDSKERTIDIDLFSSRFAIVEEKNGGKKISTVLQPNQSIIFEIRDKGSYVKDPENPYALEGVVQITVIEDASDKGSTDQDPTIPSYHFLPRLRIDLAPDPNQKKGRRYRSPSVYSMDCEVNSEDEDQNPLDKLIKIRQLPGETKKNLVEKKEMKKKKKTTTKSVSSECPSISNEKKAPTRTPEKKKKTHSTSSLTPDDTTSIEKAPPPPPPRAPESIAVVTTLDEITPKSLKLADVVFSDRPPKPSPASSSEPAQKTPEEPRKSKMMKTSLMENPQKSRKLEDVVFSKGPSNEAVIGQKSKGPSPVKKNKKGKKEKCVIS